MLSLVSVLIYFLRYSMSTTEVSKDLTGVKLDIDKTVPSSHPHINVPSRAGCQRSALTGLSNTTRNKKEPHEVFHIQAEQSDEAEARYFPQGEKEMEFTESECSPLKTLCSVYGCMVSGRGITDGVARRASAK